MRCIATQRLLCCWLENFTFNSSTTLNLRHSFYKQIHCTHLLLNVWPIDYASSYYRFPNTLTVKLKLMRSASVRLGFGVCVYVDRCYRSLLGCCCGIGRACAITAWHFTPNSNIRIDRRHVKPRFVVDVRTENVPWSVNKQNSWELLLWIHFRVISASWYEHEWLISFYAFRMAIQIIGNLWILRLICRKFRSNLLKHERRKRKRKFAKYSRRLGCVELGRQFAGMYAMLVCRSSIIRCALSTFPNSRIVKCIRGNYTIIWCKQKFNKTISAHQHNAIRGMPKCYPRRSFGGRVSCSQFGGLRCPFRASDVINWRKQNINFVKVSFSS